MKISTFNIFDRKFEKYLFKKFLINFIYFISISLLIVFLVEFTELLRRTSEIVSVSSTLYVFYLTALKTMESIAFIIPISFFGTTMITCRTLNKHREMVIAQNAGLNSFKIMYPFIFFSISESIIHLFFLGPFRAKFAIFLSFAFIFLSFFLSSFCKSLYFLSMPSIYPFYSHKSGFYHLTTRFLFHMFLYC